jgi:hypothetical protein
MNRGVIDFEQSRTRYDGERNPQTDPEPFTCYQRLRAFGKPVKVALIAVARKLLVHLNSLMTNFYKKSLAT